jgi:hypothetical protein
MSPLAEVWPDLSLDVWSETCQTVPDCWQDPAYAKSLDQPFLALHALRNASWTVHGAGAARQPRVSD